MTNDEHDYPQLAHWRRDVTSLIDKQRSACEPDLVQVWFTGVHINVGGGNDDKNSDDEGSI